MQHLKEKISRGTPDFPFATYYYDIKYRGFVTIGLHWHPEIEIIFVKKGKIEVNVAEEKIIVNAGEICFINPEELHTIATNEDDVKYYAAVFLPSLVEFTSGHFFNEQFIIPLTNGKIYFPRVISPEHFIYKKILTYIKLIFHSTHSRISVLSNLIQLFCVFTEKSLMEINQKERYSRHYEDIKRCIEYMNENYSKKITLSDLAELAHMSPNYFCSYFKECTGVSTFNQLNHIRIKKAIAFLSEGDDLIADIFFPTVKCR